MEIEQSELVKVHAILKEFPEGMTVSQVTKSIELSFDIAPPLEGRLVFKKIKRTWRDHIMTAGAVAAIMIIGLTFISIITRYGNL